MSLEESIVKELKAHFPDAITEIRVPRKARILICVKKENLVPVAQHFKEKMDFDLLVSVSGVDLTHENTFAIVYHIWSTSKKTLAILKARIPRDHPHLHSLTTVWESANWHEREIHELFGIKFEGHPEAIQLLLPEDWNKTPPLRKDFPLEK